MRGYDIANITFIEGDTDLIALDALTTIDTAAAALALYRKHRDPDGKRRLHTVMYSHSYGDHFGGVAGNTLIRCPSSTESTSLNKKMNPQVHFESQNHSKPRITIRIVLWLENNMHSLLFT